MIADPWLIDLRGTIQEALTILNAHNTVSNYEILLSSLRTPERISLQRLIMISFADLTRRRDMRSSLDFGFRSREDEYDKLVTVLKIEPDSWSIISLNYDILLEEALVRANIPFFYHRFPFGFRQDQSTEVGVRIYKPHGSINFFAHGDYKIYHHEPTPEDDRGLPTKFNQANDGTLVPNYPICMASTVPDVESILHSANGGNIHQPVMASYTKGKPVHANDLALEAVRKDALDLCGRAEEILIIGVKPVLENSDDAFVASLFSMPFANVEYVSKSSQDCLVIKELYKTAVLYSQGLIEFLCLSRE